MSLFDGLTGLFEGVFDGPVTITPSSGAAYAARGIFREEPGVQDDLDGNDTLVVQPVLTIRHVLAPRLARGDGVTVESQPDRYFEVLTVQPSRSQAADRHLVAVLSEVAGP